MQAFTSPANITSDYIKEQYLYTQQNGNYVKLTGRIILAKEIPSGNTEIGIIYTPNKPITDMYFLLVTPQGALCLSYITKNAEIVVCNYIGYGLAANTDLYIIGLEWFFD